MDELKEISKEEIFKIWAPKDSLWSPWVKPVLFACMDTEPEPPLHQSVNLNWVRRNDTATAYVVDLPGAKSVWAGLGFLNFRFRPVPLYNALPSPLLPPQVNVRELMAPLWHGASAYNDANLAADAPPVFMLDWNRRKGRKVVGPGYYDNRSISFPTDFPSAKLLQSRKISRVVLVQEEGDQPQEDLSQTLMRWQDAGITIELKLADDKASPRQIQVKKPTLLKIIWWQALALLGRNSNSHGGFGRIILQGAGG